MDDKEKKLVEAIAQICEELGWSIAIPSTIDDEDAIDGLIIGTQEFIEVVLQQSDDFDEMDPDNEELMDGLSLKKDTKETVH